ncbi:alcohol dehydrogenase catalytic domain-containing protein [Streptacidiphilus sp. EB103A]|uniref:alcohol dehydrogenase catalytic domain-containing protein n=1 Tax=Streptacidiphilus sp. EB103A TaxID=3156275 RepID=UPI003517F1F9
MAIRFILVRVEAIGVNFRDLYERSGAYPHEVPFVPGREAAGTVLALGPGVADHTVGDTVATVDAPRPGAYSERIAVRTERAVAPPPGVSAKTAAAIMLQGLTADYLCSLTHPVGPSDVVVVHAAAGGTGGLLTQMAKLRGARVVATVSTAYRSRALPGVRSLRPHRTPGVRPRRRHGKGDAA